VLTAQIDWGDGSAKQLAIVNNSTGQIEIGHVYSAVGFYEVIVSVSDEYGEQAVETFNLMIGHSAVGGAEDPPTDSSFTIDIGTTPKGKVGEVISLVGTQVISNGPLGVLVAEIDWGDGQGSKPAILIEETGIVVSSHTYGFGSAGVYTATLTVRNDFGGSATAQINVIITSS
jgi:PKD repeat protein